MPSFSDVYDYTDKLKELLIKQGKVLDVSLKFKDINENSARIKFLQNLLVENNLIADDGKLKLEKSNVIADSCRLKGNKFYSNKQFLDAMEAYNQSLCFAESDSEQIGLAYANRSAVYYELELFDNCLNNIRLAKMNKYPEKNIMKLENREVMCLEKINNVPSNKVETVQLGAEFLKLSYQPNKKLPFIANCLEVKSDKKFGRFITSKVNLKPGDVVAVEEPYSKVLMPIHRYKYCATCLADNFLDLISCNNCTSTMYCSNDCAINGNEKFHKYDCEVVDKLNSLSTKIILIAVRTFFEALHDCGNISELITLVEESERSPKTAFDYTSYYTLDKKNVLQAIVGLASNESERNGADLFQRSGIVAIISHLLLNKTPLKDLLVNDKEKDFFRSFLFKQTQISASNYHGLFHGVVKKSELESNAQYGMASFPFCSLINHSCAPNLVRVTTECKNIVVINRPIPAGGQLFDNYGFHHCLEDLGRRQSSLLNQYMFKCTCEACTGNFPLYFDLPMIDGSFQKLFSNDIQKLSSLDINYAKSRFKIYCNYLMKHDRSYPCWEVSSIQECMLRCFTIFSMSEFKLKLCAK